MSDKIFLAFLDRQFEEAGQLQQRSDRLDIVPLEGKRARTYLVRLRCKGLIRVGGDVKERDGWWAIGVRFPEDYLRIAPQVAQVLTFLSPVNVWHPNVLPPFVCLHVATGTPLTQLIYALYDLLTWNSYATGDDGLNKLAAQWARRQSPDRFPVDRTPLVRGSR